MVKIDSKVSSLIWNFSEKQILLDIKKFFLLVRWMLVKQMRNIRNIFRFEKF